jgi:hypothetical protein
MFLPVLVPALKLGLCFSKHYNISRFPNFVLQYNYNYRALINKAIRDPLFRKKGEQILLRNSW